MELNTITEIEKELTRFKLRLDAALDLKNELTKITR